MMRMRTLVLLVLAVMLSSVRLSGQQLSESYYRENYPWLGAEWWVGEDNPFLQGAAAAYSPFEEYAIYGLSFVDYDYRGSLLHRRSTLLGSISLDSPFDRYGNYNLSALLRRVPAVRENSFYNSHNHTDAALSAERFATSPRMAEPEHRLRLQFSTRTYNLAAAYSQVAHPSEDFALSIAMGCRGGRDAAVEGVFSEQMHLWLAGEWHWGDAEDYEQSLQLAFMVAPDMRSGRSWGVEEIFELSGDNHYNSYWGWQNGKVRSSRVTRQALPALYGEWNLDDNILLTNLNLSLLLSGGRRTRTSLEWADAPNPTPDYYAYLPSAFANPAEAAEVRAEWVAQNRSTTQIDWHHLHRVNHFAEDGSHYALFGAREDRVAAQFDLSGALLGLNEVRVGVRGGYHTSHNYNRAEDLLGGQRLADGFDHYDYSLHYSNLLLYTSLNLHNDWGQLSTDVEFGPEAVGYQSAEPQRVGNKEFTSLRSRIGWSYSGERGRGVGAVVHYHHKAPLWSALFGAPEGAMCPNPYARAEDWVGGQLWGEYTIDKVSLHGALYADYDCGGGDVELFWDSIGSAYSALLAGRMACLGYGVELSAEVKPFSGFKAEAHLALSTRRYVSDGVADIVTYDEGLNVARATTLHLAGHTATASPSLVTALSLSYFTPSGWLLGGDLAWVGGRTLEPSLLLLSDYVLSMGLSPEELDAFVSPVGLGSATNLDLFVYRRFGTLSVSLSLCNVLGFTDGYSGGYRTSRVALRSNDHSLRALPYAPRYQHIYPRHFYLTIGYEF